MQPVVNGLKEQYKTSIKFADLDFYDPANRPLVQQFRVGGHPTFVLTNGQGQAVKVWVGVVEEASLKEGFNTVVR